METEVKVDFIQKISEYSKEVFRMHNDMEYLCEVLNSLDIKLLREYYLQDKSGPIIDLRKEVIREIMLGSISPIRLEEIIQKYKLERSQEMKAWKNPYKILHTIINTKYYDVDEMVDNFIGEVKSRLGFNIESHLVNFDGANNMGGDQYWVCFYAIGGDRSKIQIFLSIKDGISEYGVYSHVESKYLVGPNVWTNIDDFLNFVDQNKDVLVVGVKSEPYTFVEAAKFVLLENENKPMTSKEIWDRISELGLKLNSVGKTPQTSLSANLLYNSVNSNTEQRVKNPIFEVTSVNPNKFILKNYVPKKIKESLIEDGFIHISKLKEILESMGYKSSEN